MMRVAHMTLKESCYRPWATGAMVLGVAVAAACITAAVTSLRLYDARTQALLQAAEAATRSRVWQLEDDYRVIMKRMGYNVLIVASNENIAALHARGVPARHMPEHYCDMLATSQLMTIRHLLPSLQQVITWPDTQHEAVLIGVRGEAAGTFGSEQTPLLQPVEPGMIVLGHTLAAARAIGTGAVVHVLGRAFHVARVQAERGTRDDISAWIALRDAQTLLKLPGRISCIMALECACTADALADIRAEIARVLPGVQALELAAVARGRMEARRRAAQEAQAAVAAVHSQRTHLRGILTQYAGILTPSVMLISAVWVGLCALGNVRERRSEIAIIRALGGRTRTVLMLFLSKALAVGAIGSVLGCAAGIAGSVAALGLPTMTLSALLPALRDVLVVTLLGVPLLAMAASWVPAAWAAAQDPATILREE
jgi:cell division protein FtsX